jgi:hypothetical protein
MAPVPVFHAPVSENGKLVLEPAERYQRQGYLRRLAGKSVDVVVKPHRH